MGQSYYNAWYLSRELRKLGWKADVLNWDPNPASQIYYHGEDHRFEHRGRGDVRRHLRYYQWAARNYDVFHFTGVGAIRFGHPLQDWFRRRFSEGAEIRLLKRLGKKVVYSQNSCNDGVAQSSFASWGERPVCLDCPFLERPDVCSDERNLAWGEFRNSVADYQVLMGANRLDYNLDPRCHEVPEYYCLDPEFWRPDLEIPPERRLDIPERDGQDLPRGRELRLAQRGRHLTQPEVHPHLPAAGRAAQGRGARRRADLLQGRAQPRAALLPGAGGHRGRHAHLRLVRRQRPRGADAGQARGLLPARRSGWRTCGARSRATWTSCRWSAPLPRPSTRCSRISSRTAASGASWGGGAASSPSSGTRPSRRPPVRRHLPRPSRGCRRMSDGGPLAAIHQPNFLPWLGYFDKVARADVFVLLDDAQFQKMRGTWTNRVQLLVGGEPAAGPCQWTAAIPAIVWSTRCGSTSRALAREAPADVRVSYGRAPDSRRLVRAHPAADRGAGQTRRLHERLIRLLVGAWARSHQVLPAPSWTRRAPPSG